MKKFDFSDVNRYNSRFEDVSEPLKEYHVNLDGSLEEVSSSCSLLGVRQNGKWGWIDTSGRFVISAVFDFGFVNCFDGIIVLSRNGCQGAIFRDDLSQAFQFKYKQLGHFYRDTFCAWNFNGKCALLKPGDIKVTDFKYDGFSKYNQGNITQYVRTNFFGMQVKGNIDILTGKELS